jgi:8-oxo-dGTP pyrophosphatase MutT (NUDIX family)
VRTKIRKLIQDVVPHDELEQEHVNDALSWIDSGAPLFRIAKPDNPPKHLVSYFAIFDEEKQSLLLIDHKLAGKWLLTGGHVDIDEHPSEAAVREAKEELGMEAEFHKVAPAKPFFISIMDVINVDGTGAHTDVSLWHVLSGRVDDDFTYDESEFTTLYWRTLDEVLDMDIATLDPHLHRFVYKLKGALRE